MRFDDEINSNENQFSDDGFNNEVDISGLEYNSQLTEEIDLLSLSDDSENIPLKKQRANKGHSGLDNKETRSKKPLIITLCSIGGVLVLILVVVACMFLFKGAPNNGDNGDEDSIIILPDSQLKVEPLSLDGVSADYIIASGVEVNGVDIGGKTIAQAKKLLASVEKSLFLDFNYTVKVGEQTEIMKSSDLNFDCNTENVLATAVKYTESLGERAYNEDNPVVKMDITCNIDNKKIDDYIISVADKFKQEAKDAEITAFHPWQENKFEYSESQQGYEVEAQELSSKFYELYNDKKTSGTITPQTNVVEPEVTVDFLKENIIGLASHWTYSGNTANGNNNMKIALERSNGAVIKPGETYSFASYSGDTGSAAEGYLPAIVYMNGRSVLDIGGGACQAATTIYGAAVYANLGIVERQGHIYCSAYTQSGFDATISYGSIDLKLLNKTKFPVFFETKMEGTKLTCNIYGYQDPSFDDIATYSYNYNYYSGREFSTRAYRIYLKDGVEVDREFLNTSTYSLRNNHYMVASDPGTIGARPGGEERSVHVTPDPNDGPVVDHNTGGNNHTDPSTDPPATDPTSPPETDPTEPSVPATEPTDQPTDSTEPTDSSSESDPTENTDSTDESEDSPPDDNSEPDSGSEQNSPDPQE